MNELQAILNAFEESQHNRETAFLATLVNVKGSSYRLPGARMLMTNTGRIVGSISGGCLDKDLLERAKQGIDSGKPIVVKYDTTVDEDIVWGLGLGCNGVVQVLIERLDGDRPFNPMTFLSKCLRDRQLGVLATVFGVEGSVNTNIGTRLTFNSDDSTMFDIVNPHLVRAIAADVQHAFSTQQSTVNKYKLATGSVDVFVEVIQPPTPVIIFGAGRDAVPVVNFAKALGWHVTIVDCLAREETRNRFPIADSVILTRPEAVREQICLSDRTVAVIMTHNYLHDIELLKILLPSPVCYLGILGAKHRTERLFQDILAAGIVYTETQFQRLHRPVGLDIGADTPEEIALSIVAEIQAVLKKRSGGFLRDRQGSIHPHFHVKILHVEQFDLQYAIAEVQ